MTWFKPRYNVSSCANPSETVLHLPTPYFSPHSPPRYLIIRFYDSSSSYPVERTILSYPYDYFVRAQGAAEDLFGVLGTNLGIDLGTGELYQNLAETRHPNA